MLLSSKYPGKCLTCGDPIAVGDRVSWTKGVKGVKHAACSDEGKEVAAAVATSRATESTDCDAPAPAGLSYLPYQRAGIAYALARRGTLIADEMGLGKTIQAIGVINGDETVRRVIIVCPASLRLNWKRELERWAVRPLTIGIANGKLPETDVVIVNYDVLKKHREALAAVAWDLAIVDEAHYCKNSKAQRTQHTQAVCALARRRVLLTGTPIANRPVELFPLLQIADPEAWDPAGKRKGVEQPAGSGCGFFRFAKRYCNAHQTSAGNRMVWDFSGASNLPELQERLRATCMIRRLKSEVLTDLPAKRRQVIELAGGEEAVDEERSAWARHEEALEGLRVQVELSRADEDPASYAAAVDRLRAGSQLAFTEIARARHATALAKVDAALEHVENALESSAKVVLFAHHKDLIAKLSAGLAQFSPVVLTGDTEMADRQAAVDRFQTDPACRVFLGSITAAGVGLTLTAAAHVVFAELDWVPGNVSQAEDRCHRIGQRSSVLVQHLVLSGSLDARMARILVAKQDVADRALDRLAPEASNEPVIPAGETAATEGRRAALEAAAAKLTPLNILAIHDALQRLAGLCDGASTEDGMGFAKIDVRIGHSLARAARLTPKQAALGQRLVRKYRRQLGAGTLDACGLAETAEVAA